MIDLETLSRRFDVRRLDDADADAILALYRDNPQFYEYYEEDPTRELVLRDLHIAPPGAQPADKYYVGFFEQNALVAVMDLIDGYPAPDVAYIGLFMLARAYQGNGLGTQMVSEIEAGLRSSSKTAIRLAINKGNPQSTHFWDKNGFAVVKEVEKNGWWYQVAEKRLTGA